MQIRIANRQDEPEIRTLVESICKESGSPFDIETSDSDLRNIDANYFGHEGLFLVAEDEGKIVGVAGAKRKTDLTLELKRLIAKPGDKFIPADLLGELLSVIVEFAPRLLYERIDVASPTKEQEKLLIENGFAPAIADGALSLRVTPDF